MAEARARYARRGLTELDVGLYIRSIAFEIDACNINEPVTSTERNYRKEVDLVDRIKM
jgi:hypothetical protein